MKSKIILGDSYNKIKEIPDKSIDLIVTDPPYDLGNMRISGIMKDRNKAGNFINEILESELNNGIDFKIFEDFIRVLKKINIYIWCNKKLIYPLLKYWVEEHNCNYEILIWAKENPIPFCNTHYLVDKEYCLYFWEQGAQIDIPFERAKTVFFTKTNVEDKKNFTHPTIKPIEIIETLIKNSSVRGGVIFDPFLGSGTTARAAKNLGRNYIGIEINPKYFKIAEDRLKGINQKGELNIFELEEL